MPTTIDIENAKKIRTPMDINVVMNGLVTRSLSYVAHDYVLYDSTLGNTDYPMRGLADIAGDGFPLDGTRVLYDVNMPASAGNGKIGYRSEIGANAKEIVVSGIANNASITVLAINVDHITANGEDYIGVADIFIIPVIGTSVTLEIYPEDPAERVEVNYIKQGTAIAFDNSNIVSLTVSLRSDLSIVGQTLPASEIEIQAYWPNDIALPLSQVNDNMPITYTAGYDGEMSPPRSFYITGEVTQESNLITIHAQDYVGRMENNLSGEVLEFKWRSGFKSLYNDIKATLGNAGVPITADSPPPVATGIPVPEDRPYSCLYKSESLSVRDYIAIIMNYTSIDCSDRNPYGEIDYYIYPTEYLVFWPRFVDAGRPCLTWRYPTVKWTLDESECSTVEQTYDRPIRTIKGEFYEYKDTTNAVVGRMNVVKGAIYTMSFDTLCMLTKLTRGNIIKTTAASVRFKATSTGEAVATGRVLERFDVTKNKEINDIGLDVEWNAQELGYITQTSWDVSRDFRAIYPGDIELCSTEKGRFTFKGDPRWQPRDVVEFTRLDGTTENITIEEITITHEGGGTIAEVTYRKGIC